MALFDKVKKFIKTDDLESPVTERAEEKKEEKKPDQAVRADATHPIFSWVLYAPHISEKATNLALQNQYVFRISPHANAFQVKRAVETRYNVHVEDVHMITIPAKVRRVRGKRGYRAGFVKAVVRVRQGESIASSV
ncbi:MAG: 50S ribosomal protein L23 [Parcubacteria group bacterium]|nr:50S ribosomal protein L23 [Parcubacteria group bacterium]